MIYARLAGVVAILGLLAGLFFYGKHMGKVECENEHLRIEKQEAADRGKNITTAQDNDLVSAEANVIRETTVREIIREVPKIIERPVYRNVCADSDGVQLLERAVQAANGRAPTRGANGNPTGVPSPSGSE